MRIRTIKPEFWANERIAAWPPLTRLAYVGLWNEADDEGRLRGSPAYLASRIFPYEKSLDMKKVLAPIQNCGKLVLFEHEGQHYGYLPGFNKHQRINRPSPSKLPKPDDCEASLDTHGGLTEDSLKAHQKNLLEQGTGIRDQVTGNKGGNGVSGLVLEHWNKATGQRRKAPSLTSQIQGRLKEGYTREELCQVIDWVAESKDERAVFLRGKGPEPETVFRAANFEKYLERSRHVSQDYYRIANVTVDEEGNAVEKFV